MFYKATFIMPYFGNWPYWFSFFLESCRFNPDYRWLIFSDCGVPDNKPDNVTIVETTLKEYCERVSDSLKVRFYTSHAYKLCDIRPALGFIHAEEIQGSDYFGYCDADVVFGNINSFVTVDKINKYDLISAHDRRVVGHLSLIRNSEKMRNVFRLMPDWKHRMTHKKHFAIDEKDFSDLFIKHKNFPKRLRLLVSKLYQLPRLASLEESFSTPFLRNPWTDGTYNFPNKWFWRQRAFDY